MSPEPALPPTGLNEPPEHHSAGARGAGTERAGSADPLAGLWKLAERNKVVGALVVLFGLFLFVRPVLRGCASLKETREQSARVKRSEDNLRAIVAKLRERATSAGWPPLGGRAFVLSTVVDGKLDPVKAAGLLFSPGDRRSPAAASSYAGLDAAHLLGGRDLSGLTSYAGRRNDEERFRLKPEDLTRREPIVADVEIEGWIVVGFSDGSVLGQSIENGSSALGFHATMERLRPPAGRPALGDDAVFDTLRPLGYGGR